MGDATSPRRRALRRRIRPRRPASSDVVNSALSRSRWDVDFAAAPRSRARPPSLAAPPAARPATVGVPQPARPLAGRRPRGPRARRRARPARPRRRRARGHRRRACDRTKLQALEAPTRLASPRRPPPPRRATRSRLGSRAVAAALLLDAARGVARATSEACSVA